MEQSTSENEVNGSLLRLTIPSQYHLLSCGIVVLFLMLVLLVYGPHSGYGRSKIILVSPLVVFLFVLPFVLPYLFEIRRIEVSPSGLNVDSTHYDWEDIQRIEQVDVLLPISKMRVVLSESRDFLNLFSYQKGVYVPFAPGLFSELLPAIQSAHPDLQIQERLQAKAGREPSFFWSRGIAIISVLFSIITFSVISLGISRDTYIIILFLHQIPFIFGFIICTYVANSRDWSLYLLALIGLNHLFCLGTLVLTLIYPSPFSWNTLFVFMFLINGIGIWLVLVEPELEMGRQIIVLIGLGIIPVLSWVGFNGYDHPLPAKQVQVGENMSAPPFWSEDGSLFTDFYTTDKEREKIRIISSGDHHVVHKISLPPSSSIWYLDERYLIHQHPVQDREDGSSISVTDMKTDRTNVLTSAKDVRVSYHRSVNERRWFVWLEKSKNTEQWTPRIYDLNNNKDIPHSFTWSESEENDFLMGDVRWSEESKLVWKRRVPVDKKGKPQKERLMLGFYNVKTQNKQVWKSSEAYEEWSVSEDGQYALGISDRSEGKTVHLIKIGAGRVVSKPFDKKPIWLGDKSVAIGIQSNGEESILTLLDARSGDIRRLGTVPSGMNWIGLSGSGKYALFQTKGDQLFHQYLVMNLREGWKRPIYLTNFFGSGSNPISYRRINYFSPDDRGLLLSAFGLINSDLQQFPYYISLPGGKER